MFDYAALEAIAAVLREGSFERAARRLHVTPSAISQRIKQLEERMGQVLVLRGSPCTGTDAGRQLCLHFEQVALLENSLRRNHPGLHDGQVTTSPTLQLAVNADSLSTWFMDAVAAFADAGNELLDLRIDDQDHTAQRLRDGEVLAQQLATGFHGLRSGRKPRFRRAPLAAGRECRGAGCGPHAQLRPQGPAAGAMAASPGPASTRAPAAPLCALERRLRAWV